MAIGDIARGLMDSFSGYVTTERDRRRKAEDDEIGFQQELIKSLAERPDANPALLGKALHDLVSLQQAKGSKRKLKAGDEGFLGASEMPISQFLEGMRQGINPMMGRTTEATPMPQLPTQAAGVQGPNMAELKYKGISDLGSGPMGGDRFINQIPGVNPAPEGARMPVDASKLAQASRDMATYQSGPKRRPVANQPVLRSPEEMAEQEGMEQGTIYKARAKGQRDADIEMFQESGLSPEEIRQVIKAKALGTTAAPNWQTYVYMMPDGTRFSARVDTRTAAVTDEQGRPFTIPEGAVRIGIGPPNQLNYFQDDLGNVSGIATNRFAPQTGAQSIPIPPNAVQGRTSPEGPVATVTDPVTGDASLVRMPRRGQDAEPVTIPAEGSQGVQGTQGADGIPNPPQRVGASAAPTAEAHNLPLRLASVRTTVNELDEMSKAINTGQGLTQLMEGIGRTGASYINKDDPVKLYREIRGAFAAQLSRLSGEVGVLTDQDVARALGWVPNPWDSMWVRDEKIRLLRQFLDEKMNRLPGRAALPGAPDDLPQVPQQEAAPPPVRTDPNNGRQLYFTGRFNPRTGNPIYSHTPQ